MKTYDIYIGTRELYTYHYTRNEIEKNSLVEVQMLDLVGEKLSIDTFQPIVYDPDNDLEALLSRNQLVSYYVDNQLKGKYFIDEIISQEVNWYQLNCTSGIGLLENAIHKGGLYEYTESKTFSEVLAEILGGTVGTETLDGLTPIAGGIFDCYVERWASNVVVSGYLPYGNARENLHSLMLAQSVVLTKDDDGDIIFSYLYDQSNAPTIPDISTYKGGSKTKNSAANRIEVTEHTYINNGTSDQEITLFDGTLEGAADNSLIPFPNPIHDLRSEGTLTIHESGRTYARITGGGKLFGRAYTDSTMIVSIGTSVVKEKVITVTDDYMINALNSTNVLNRLYSFYANGRTAEVSFKYNGEKCGRKYNFYDNYGVQRSGFIDSMTRNASGIIKADAKIVTDFVPTGQGDNYQNAVVLSGTGTWDIPSSVFEKTNPKIRVALIGGGNGGQGGENGGASPTNPATSSFYGSAGEGGEGGVGGLGGKIYITTINITSETSFDFECGVGGQGGTNGAEGEVGTDTIFGTYTSASGSQSVSGFTNLFTGDVYGKSGKNGVKGGKGGRPFFLPPSAGYYAEDVTYEGVTHYGGANATAYIHYTDLARTISGGGGGASADNNGNDRGNGSDTNYRGGYGANTNDKPQASMYGAGGDGSHGGGGGGVTGVFASRRHTTDPWGYGTITGAHGGYAGHGGQGGDGCVVIYY